MSVSQIIFFWIVFAGEKKAIKNFKKSVLMVAGAAVQKLMQTLAKEEEILMNVDSIKYESNLKSIDVIIGRIRQKIEENSKDPKYLLSIRGVGYKFINQ